MPMSPRYEYWRMNTLKMANLLVIIPIPTSFLWSYLFGVLRKLKEVQRSFSRKNLRRFYLVFTTQWSQTLTQIKPDSKANFYIDFEFMLLLQPKKMCDWHLQLKLCMWRSAGITTTVQGYYQLSRFLWDATRT